jgi:muconate cycloisomerase
LVLQALQEDMADVFNCSPASLFEFVRMADLAGAAGKPCWHGSAIDLGLLDLAYIHACAVPEAATIPHDILSTPMHVDDFVVDMPRREGERIAVPDTPGLGGELDMRAIEKFRLSSGEIR